MSRSLKLLKAAFLIFAVFLPSMLFAQSVGQAVGVSQNAFLNRDGRDGYLEQGGDIFLGDVISTGNSGQVQIIFNDGTKIAISQNSTLVIERVLFDSSNTASEFTVNAVGGAFRFLSGNSSPSSYSIRTSNATMGVRGTAFDFAASARGEVRVATFDGEVELCNQMGRCASIPGGCSTAGIDASGQFITPQNKKERSAFLDRGFPYIRNQSFLRQDYRTRVESCSGGDGAGVDGGDRDRAAAPSPSPTDPAPSNPSTGGARAGGNTSAGSGGSTAGGTDAGRGGPSAPGDADASGGQASSGGPGGASAGGGGASAGK